MKHDEGRSPSVRGCLLALRRSRKIVRDLKEGLTEEERYAVADHAVAQLKERGDPWRLNEEAPTAGPPST
jgi:hypothetical protein